LTAVLRTVPHAPAEECLTVHCHVHHVDEDGTGAYRACAECGHVYRTARELRRTWRRKFWEMSDDLPLWRRVRRALTVRASRIDFCQHCVHDF
jgi:hypothetical protein